MPKEITEDSLIYLGLQLPPPDPTSKPQEVVDRAQQLHCHVIVHQGVLQHSGLQTQIPHVLPHPALAALLVVSAK